MVGATINAPGIISNPQVEQLTTTNTVKKVNTTNRVEGAVKVLIVEEDVEVDPRQVLTLSILSLKVLLKNNTSQKSPEVVLLKSTLSCSMSSRMPYSKE